MNGNNSIQFTQNDTELVKGLAIVIMLLHHLFVIPERMNKDMQIISYITIFNEQLTIFIGRYGNICISLFLFLSGFGLMKKYENVNSLELANGIFTRLKNLLLAYWKVFVIVVPISYLFFRYQPDYNVQPYYNKFVEFRWEYIISAFVGLMPERICGEWWFLRIYFSMLLIFPIVRIYIKKNRFWKSFFTIFLLTIFLVSIYPNIIDIKGFMGLTDDYIYNNFFFGRSGFAPSFFMGVLMGYNNNISKLDSGLESIGLKKWYFEILILLFCVYIRNMIVGYESDPFLIPIITCVFRNLISRMKVVTFIFRSLGRHSTTMWLTHSLYIYYWGGIQRFILMPRYAFGVGLLFVIFTWLIAIFIDVGYMLLVNFIKSRFICHK